MPWLLVGNLLRPRLLSKPPRERLEQFQLFFARVLSMSKAYCINNTPSYHELVALGSLIFIEILFAIPGNLTLVSKT